MTETPKTDSLTEDLKRLLARPETEPAAARPVLARLDRLIEALATELEVEVMGPEVGLDAGRSVYRLVVRAHRLGPSETCWGVWVCTALPHAGLRADWRLAAVSGRRRAAVIRVLPEFLAGFAAAAADAGKGSTRAGARLAALACALASPRP